MSSRIGIKVRLYASYREWAGCGSIQVSIPTDSTVADLIVQLLDDLPSLPRDFKPHLIAVNDEFANLRYPLGDNDEVALYPPVSGGIDAAIANTKIDTYFVTHSIHHDYNGAVVTFEGTTRNETDGESVLFLEYEADGPMAQRILANVLEETCVRFGLPSMAAQHRIGRLEIGDVSLAVAAGAPHRLEAFLACQYAVDRIKHIVPIWKKEYFTDGSVWIGAACEPEHHARELSEAPYALFLSHRETNAAIMSFRGKQYSST